MSSYLNNDISYLDIFKLIIFLKKTKKNSGIWYLERQFP